MACCAAGVAITALVVRLIRFVRTRVLEEPERPESVAWRLVS